VAIDAPCLDCGDSVHLEIRDGEILNRSPETLTGYVKVPISKWMENIAYA
jgi:hypothetical protein